MKDEGRYNKDIVHILNQDLKSSKILNLGYVSDSSDPHSTNLIYYLKQTPKKRKFYLKSQPEPFNKLSFT